MRWSPLPLIVALLVAGPAAAATRAIDAPSAARLTLQGPPAGGTGTAVAQLGDVNGDGRPDVAVGAPFADLPGRPDAGSVFVVFGSRATGTQSLEAGGDGFRIIGGRYYRAGLGVAAAGDVNRDGRPDVLLSAPRKGVAGYKTPGSAYVVFGKPGTETIDLTQLTSAQGFEIVGVVPHPAATPDNVAGAGDVDRDGYDDVLVTVGTFRKRGFDYRGGAAVIYGSRHPRRVDLQRLGSRGFRLTAAANTAGPTVAGAGDVNGDHRADLLLGAAHVLLPGRRYPVNSVFVVFGRRHQGTIDLRRLGSRGFRIGGLVRRTTFFPGVAGIGDLNSDRRADVLVIRDPGGSVGRRPQAAVVFGSRSTRTVDLGHLGARGFRILGEPATGRFSGLGPVAGLGDVDADGIPDFGLGSYTQAAGGRFEHSAFVVFGRRATSTVSLEDLGAGGFRLTGPAGSETCGARGVGAALAPAGDPDGNGQPDLLVGAPALGDCAGQALVVPAG
jgi:FG-GAP repeat protein